MNSTTSMMNKLLQIILEIIRIRNEQLRYSNRQPQENIKVPKIRYGEMKTAEYNKLLKEGEKMRTVSVPTDKLENINDYAKKLGAKYWVMEDEGKTATIVVPESYYNQFNDALQQSIKEQLTMPNNECLVLIRGMRPFRTDKFDLVNHPRYSMLDEADKQHNTYYLSENIHTKEEEETLNFGEVYDTGDTVGMNNIGTITVSYVSSDNNVIVPLSELNKNIKPEINAIFAEVGKAYSAEIA